MHSQIPTPPPPLTTTILLSPSFLPQNHHKMELQTVTLILLHISLPFFSSSSTSEASYVGVNYGRIGNNLLPPSQVVALLLKNSISHVKTFDTDSTVLHAFSNSGIKLTVCLPDNLIPAVANSTYFAQKWVSANIVAFLPHTEIETIAVGNEVFSPTKRNFIPFLVTAMEKIHAALVFFNLHHNIKVSSPTAFNILQTSYPSSTSHFYPDLVDDPIKQMLTFFRRTGSFFMINIYPFFAYESNADDIPLDYALLRKNPGIVDTHSGRRYFSLFDAQMDAVYSALSAIGFHDMKVVVSETGWPSRGDDGEVGAGVENAGEYNRNLVKRILFVKGTQLRPNADIDVFLFALFNENQKPGAQSERNFGIFYPNGEMVYEMAFSRRGVLSFGKGKVGNESWCISKPGWNKGKLQAALDYACGEGGADCRLIQAHAKCFAPDTLENHASFAFNSYYQKKGRSDGSCYFAGGATIVYKQPVVGRCKLSSAP